MDVYECSLVGPKMIPRDAHNQIINILGGNALMKCYPDGRLLFNVDYINGQSVIRVRTPAAWIDQLKKREYITHEGTKMRYRIKLWRGKRTMTKTYHALTETELPEWFEKQADRHGFAATIESTHLFTCNTNNKHSAPSAVVEGTLTVKNQAQFEIAVRAGIGRCKAYGFGMLQLNY